MFLSFFVRSLFLPIALLFSQLLCAQVTIAFQGFENDANDNWNFTSPFQNVTAPIVTVGVGNYGTNYASSGLNSMRIGGGSTACGNGSSNCINNSPSGAACNNNQNGAILEMNNIDISCYNDVQLMFAYRTHVNCTSGGQNEGQGLDASDVLFFELSYDNGPWQTVGTINGSGDCAWTYLTSTVSCITGQLFANPFVHPISAGIQTVKFRVRLVINRANEVLYIDNVRLTGIPNVLPAVLIQHHD